MKVKYFGSLAESIIDWSISKNFQSSPGRFWQVSVPAPRPITAARNQVAELYGGIGSGMVDTYRSHRHPAGQHEGGDTTGGGGDRDDFRDSLLFQAIRTGSDGRGSTTFRLSDDLTSWRVTASAVR